MLRKIRIEDLRVGMVIEKIDGRWLDHPFLSNRKKITSQDQILSLRDCGITEVYVAGGDGAVDVGGNVHGLEEGLEEPLENEVPLERELLRAQETVRKAHSVVRDVMSDVRLGKNIEIGKVAAVVGTMIDSIFRNADALASLTRLKGYDEYTFVHSVNVGVLCIALGRHAGFGRRVLENLGIGGLLHDTGKIRVAPSILNKPGRLDEAEMAEMRRHPDYSVRVLEQAGGIPEAGKEAALLHHERWDGSGYPRGLRGGEIGRYGAIAAICDVYDAMTSDRCYQKGMPAHEGVRRIHGMAGKHFPEDVVDLFVRSIGIYPVGTAVRLDTGEIGVVTALNREFLLRPFLTILYRDRSTCLDVPYCVDLREKSPGGRFARTIVEPLDPSVYAIDPRACFPKAFPATAG